MDKPDPIRQEAAEHFKVPYDQVTAAQRHEIKNLTFFRRYFTPPPPQKGKQ